MPQSDYPVVSALPWEGDGGGGGGAGSTWPLKRVAELAGDVVIGGLHMIHERNARMTCGPIMPQGGVQVGACRRNRGAGNARHAAWTLTFAPLCTLTGNHLFMFPSRFRSTFR